jgi:hypothetical protein
MWLCAGQRIEPDLNASNPTAIYFTIIIIVLVVSSFLALFTCLGGHIRRLFYVLCSAAMTEKEWKLYGRIEKIVERKIPQLKWRFEKEKQSKIKKENGKVMHLKGKDKTTEGK